MPEFKRPRSHGLHIAVIVVAGVLTTAAVGACFDTGADAPREIAVSDGTSNT